MKITSIARRNLRDASNHDNIFIFQHELGVCAISICRRENRQSSPLYWTCENV
ncbi:hypothetical protein BDR07DRAFT_1397826 [Suillus spraguei]|nr:hypothetical protein BDR07DRAFT_1397826 [Suillus spraguei]